MLIIPWTEVIWRGKHDKASVPGWWSTYSATLLRTRGLSACQGSAGNRQKAHLKNALDGAYVHSFNSDRIGIHCCTFEKFELFRERRQRLGETVASDTTQNKMRMNRREFLNLAWLASLGFLLVNLGGVAYLFAMPRFREGEFGGVLTIGQVNALPPPESPPLNYPRVKVWLSNTDRGVTALYKVCTHLGCLYNWNNQENKFICPCHGSEFDIEGIYITGPALRSLDRFVVRLLDAQGNEVASTDSNGNPLPLPGEDLQVVVETGQLIRGKPRGVSYPVT